MRIAIVSGKDEGPTKLNAFDNALSDAGIGDVNLIKVSSMLAGNAEICDLPKLKAGSMVNCVLSELTSDNPGDVLTVVVAVAIGDELGCVVETSGINKDSKDLNWMQKSMMEVTNLDNKSGSLADALKGADIFVGVSAPNIVTAEMVKTMNKDSIIFAMANPTPEIMPDVAKEAGARVVGTGRSDFPNQVNNVIAFPGIFKGALEGRATQITEEMKLAAATAIASLVSDDELSDVNILPEAFDERVADVVAKAVKDHIK
jgi:pyruvoyl-dependent arginine decarboxylase